jgi:hypothetical protein
VQLTQLPTEIDQDVHDDLRTLATFIRVYCREKHGEDVKRIIRMKDYDLEELMGETPILCPACAQLLAHALTKRVNCPMHPKPACKHCPNHCYHPAYRAAIRDVMKVSGRHMVMNGRIDFLLHLLL